MKKDLIIVESPTKAKTINRFLGKKYNVVASMGHLRDLPKSALGVDVEKNYKPKYEIPQKARKNVKKIKDAYKTSENVYLATDEDREGESISWHIAHILSSDRKLSKKDLKRITFHEITEDAINHALETPRKVNIDLVDAQQARRVLDRLVGYKLSPILWKKIQFGLSAGRVQSVALRLIVQRERERQAFKQQQYYTISGDFYTNNKKDSFPSDLISISGKKLIVRKKKGDDDFLITTPEKAKEVLADIKTKEFSIKEVTEKEKNRYTYPPYTTSTLQQAASNLAGYSSSRTMRAAQKLYENGHITYHRTDSIALSTKFINMAQKFIKKEFGDNYYLENKFKNKSKNAQEAHEAIRPTDLKLRPDQLTKMGKEEQVVYELIYARSIASLMTPIKTNLSSIDIESTDNKYQFKTTGSRVLFDGWAGAYKFVKTISYNPLSGDVILPVVEKSEQANLVEAKSEEKMTMPPARYSEASLIKALEKYGIGRPSTYAPTITTLTSRKYVEKENKYLFPTDLGMVVTKLLEDHFEDVMDYEFTAKIEGKLDEVAGGNQQWEEVVDSFYKPFVKKLDETENKVARADYKVLGEAPSDIKCPECKSKMVIKLGKKGKFYSCSKFPDCNGARFLTGETEQDLEKKADTKDFKNTYMPAPKTDDGRDYLLKKGRFGEFWAHPDYPKVKDAQPLQERPEILEKKYGKAPKTDDGREFVFKKGRYGAYWSHPDYPKVKETVRIKETKDDSEDSDSD